MWSTASESIRNGWFDLDWISQLISPGSAGKKGCGPVLIRTPYFNWAEPNAKNYFNVFFMLFLLESMYKVAFCRRKMSAWRVKLDDGGMCCSCFGCIDASLLLDNAWPEGEWVHIRLSLVFFFWLQNRLRVRSSGRIRIGSAEVRRLN